MNFKRGYLIEYEFAGVFIVFYSSCYCFWIHSYLYYLIDDLGKL